MSPPGVQVIVQSKAWEDFQTGFRGIGGHAIQVRMTQHLASQYHGLFLDELDLVLILHHLPPGIDLIMDVDFHGANVRATAIQGRGKWQLTVTLDVEGWHHDDPDRTHIGRAVAEPTTPTIDGTGVHAGSTSDALE
jgi:hypothetical protein